MVGLRKRGIGLSFCIVCLILVALFSVSSYAELRVEDLMLYGLPEASGACWGSTSTGASCAAPSTFVSDNTDYVTYTDAHCPSDEQGVSGNPDGAGECYLPGSSQRMGYGRFTNYFSACTTDVYQWFSPDLHDGSFWFDAYKGQDRLVYDDLPGNEIYCNECDIEALDPAKYADIVCGVHTDQTSCEANVGQAAPAQFADRFISDCQWDEGNWVWDSATYRYVVGAECNAGKITNYYNHIGQWHSGSYMADRVWSNVYPTWSMRDDVYAEVEADGSISCFAAFQSQCDSAISGKTLRGKLFDTNSPQNELTSGLYQLVDPSLYDKSVGKFYEKNEYDEDILNGLGVVIPADPDLLYRWNIPLEDIQGFVESLPVADQNFFTSNPRVICQVEIDNENPLSENWRNDAASIRVPQCGDFIGLQCTDHYAGGPGPFTDRFNPGECSNDPLTQCMAHEVGEEAPYMCGGNQRCCNDPAPIPHFIAPEIIGPFCGGGDPSDPPTSGSCTPGATARQACGSNVGACTLGDRTAVCRADGTWGPWGPCSGQGPVAEVCGDTIDQNCDGADDICPAGGNCGNGVLDPGEQCDPLLDANCSPSCTLVVANFCSMGTCGDGYHNGALGEECDDGNRASGDGCNTLCYLESCGNGVIEPNGLDGIQGTADDEQCEPGLYENCGAVGAPNECKRTD